METMRQVIGDGLGRLVAKLGIARPGIEVDDDRLAIAPDDGVATEDLDPQRRCGAAGDLAKAVGPEGIAGHAFVTVIKPLEPIRGQRLTAGSPDAIKLNQIALDMFLRDDEGNPPLG